MTKPVFTAEEVSKQPSHIRREFCSCCGKQNPKYRVCKRCKEEIEKKV